MKKKLLLFATLFVFTAATYAQQGDLYVGAQGGYITDYKDFLFGAKVGYRLTNPLEVNFSFLMNPEIKLKDDAYPNNNSKIKMYVYDVNLCYYIIQNNMWDMGPAFGLEYGIVDNHFYNIAVPFTENANYRAFNIGWQIKCNITDNLKLSGSWKYSTGKDVDSESVNRHTFCLGIGYTFNVINK